jgi:hypothetical protein
MRGGWSEVTGLSSDTLTRKDLKISMSQGGFLQWGNVQQQFDCPDSLQICGVDPLYQSFWNIEAMCNMWISETNSVVLVACAGD